MAFLLAEVGRLAEARDLMRRLLTELELALQEGETPTAIVLQMLQASVLLGERDAIRVLAQALEDVRSMSLARNMFTCPARVLGVAAALLGKPDEARACYDQTLEVCAKIRHRPEIALTRLQLAELLLEHYPDERAEALEHLDVAISEFRDMKMQPSLERALRHRGLLKA